jgi:drug/metabolite transporter (DMT)-like permease
LDVVSRRGAGLFAVMCLVWGISYLLIKVAVAEVSVPVLVLARTAGAALVLLPLAARSIRWQQVWAHWLPLLGFAALELIGPWALLSDAERHLTSSLSGLLVAAVPIVGLVVERLFGSTAKIGWSRRIGLVIGLAGVVMLAAPALGSGHAWPIAEMVLVVLGYATAPVIASRYLSELPDLVTPAVCLGFAALVYLPFAVLAWPRVLPSVAVLGSLAGLALVCTALAFVTFFGLIREIGPARALVFTYVNPAVAVAAGVLLLGEPLSPAMVVSFGLILAGSVLATVLRRVPDAPETCAAPLCRPGIVPSAKN